MKYLRVSTIAASLLGIAFAAFAPMMAQAQEPTPVPEPPRIGCYTDVNGCHDGQSACATSGAGMSCFHGRVCACTFQ